MVMVLNVTTNYVISYEFSPLQIFNKNFKLFLNNPLLVLLPLEEKGQYVTIVFTTIWSLQQNLCPLQLL
jgi:hypothetical protein